MVFESGTNVGTNIFNEYYFFKFCAMAKFYIFIYIQLCLSFAQNRSISLNRAHRVFSGTPHFIVGTHDLANRPRKNSNLVLTSLTSKNKVIGFYYEGIQKRFLIRVTKTLTSKM